MVNFSLNLVGKKLYPCYKMTTFYHEFGDALINTLSYIELSSFHGTKFNYDVSEYIELIKAIVELYDYQHGPIVINVKLASETDIIYLSLSSNDQITYTGNKNMHHILLSNPINFLTRSLSQLKKKI